MLQPQYVITSDGTAFAVGFDGDSAACAVEVSDVIPELLIPQVEEAFVTFDADQMLLCAQVNDMLQWGEAQVIGTHFVVEI